MTAQSRSQFLKGLTTLDQLPKGAEQECAICFEPFTEPIQMHCNHIFCKVCITKWVFEGKNTCPTCRGVLFESNREAELRQQILAQALQYSGLLTNNRWDGYADLLMGLTAPTYTTAAIQEATATAHRYLLEGPHPPPTGPALLNISVLGPHLIAMGNLLRGSARATGRPYSTGQRNDSNLIYNTLHTILRGENGAVRRGVGFDVLSTELRARIVWSLQGVTLSSGGRFYENNTLADSMAADLNTLLDYLVLQATVAYRDRSAQRRALREAQQEAVEAETTRLGRWVRRATQFVFNTV